MKVHPLAIRRGLAFSGIQWLIVVAIVAVLGGACFSLNSRTKAQENEIEQLKVRTAEVEKLRADLKELPKLRDQAREANSLRRDVQELPELRNQAGQLRREREQVSRLEAENQQMRAFAQQLQQSQQQQSQPSKQQQFITPNQSQVVDPRVVVLNACIANLKQLNGGINVWALERRHSQTTQVNLLEVAPYFPGGKVPTCPGGGSYQTTLVKDPPSCNLHGTVEKPRP